MAAEAFNPAQTAIRPGVSLIEASAGTGKTYAIAMLVLRMVVERNLLIDNILVVTFTVAATEELKDRIRARLAEALSAVKSGASSDAVLTQWLQGIDVPMEDCRKRLELALLDIDQAAVFTIHGFCQRVLSEHALASGQMFRVELTDDLPAFRQNYADDFWRREVQSRAPWEAAIILKHYVTPEKLLEDVSPVNNQAIICPEGIILDEVLTTLKQSADAAERRIDQVITTLAPHVSIGLFNKAFTQNFDTGMTALADWLKGDSLAAPEPATLAYLTTNGLLNGLNGNKFKTTKEKPGEERKQEFLASLALDMSDFDTLEAVFGKVKLALRLKLIRGLQQDLEGELEKQNLWSFDSLITALAQAVNGAQGDHLARELRQRFGAALIDEFQDTDASQWLIFSRLFALPSHFLLLVGDPKQAIYKFRGADIFSYLAAKRRADFHFTLTHNWRSHPNLVEGVNRLFEKPSIFLMDEIDFIPVNAAKSRTDGALRENGIEAAPMMLWQLAEDTEGKGYWQASRNKAADLIQCAVVNEVVELLTGTYTLTPGHRRIKPQDIAILVRTNAQARAYQKTLAGSGVPSVLGSSESVFASDEAKHLYRLLEAAANPGHSGRLAQALALPWFALDGQALYRLLQSPGQLDAISARFAGYHHSWQTDGLTAMMQAIFENERIITTIAHLPDAERRLTNLNHILELLQEMVNTEGLGCEKTLAWLKQAITHVKPQSDSQQLRLESDADAVKVITLHRAKGLEFPVVFCPLLWEKSGREPNTGLVQCQETDAHGDSRSIVDLGSPDFETRRERAAWEQMAEDRRLAYVALTRAKYRCYLPWVDSRTGSGESNDSALAALLGIPDKDFSDQQALLQTLAADHPKTFAYRLVATDIEISGKYRSTLPQPELRALAITRTRYNPWQMSSYTALAAMSLEQAPELPLDKADEKSTGSPTADDGLPPGAHTGNVIHELLELIPFQQLAQGKDIHPLREQSCQGFGLTLPQPEMIDQLLANVVSTPLSTDDPGFTLAALPPDRCLKEMPFYLAMTECKTRAINRILADEPTFRPLTEKVLRGFLTGFIDLICEYGGGYYVMDYKTNLLADYGTDSLIEAMREHNYGLQYWLYSVVLHRYLQLRLPDYRFERHFGGVRYLFARGMRQHEAMSGVFQDKPDLAKLNALSDLFAHGHDQ